MSSTELPGASDGSNGAADSHAQAAPPPTAPVANRPANPELDLAKLQALPAEQQELFLLTFVASLTKHVLSLSPDDCTAQQFYLKKEVFQVLNLASPQPTRVIRNNLGRCLAHVFAEGDRKLLFETLNDLIAIVGGTKTKTDASPRSRHAAVVCLGDVFAAAGDSAIGLHPLACSSLLKLLKSSSSNAGLRAAIFVSLAKIVKMVEGSMDEQASRDMWKQARSYSTSDKGSLVIVAACRALRALVRHTRYFDNSSDFDKLQAVIFKAVDSPSSQVRHAAAETLAEAMLRGYSETGVPANGAKAKKPKSKALKRQSTIPTNLADDDDLPTSRPGSPAPSGKKSQELAFTLADVIKILSTHYCKLTTSNRARAAIGVCFGKLFRKLGEKTIETHFLRIVESLSVDLLGHWNILSNKYRLLTTRRVVDTLLQDIVGKTILGESGQKAAARSVINDILKNYPQSLPERPEPSKQTLITALGVVASLINSLGSAANTFAEICRDGLLQVLQHQSYSVQAFVLACPQQLLPCLSLGQLGSGRNSPRRCIGYAHGLAATLSASPSRPFRVLTMATNLLKSSSHTQIQVAWILIGGLMSLGPNFLLLLWKNAMPKPLTKDNTAHRSILEASFLTHVRECALGSILSFLQYNSRLLTVDVSKRIATMLQNTTAFLRALPSKKVTEDLQDLDLMVQRRLVNLSPAGGSEALLQSNLLTLAISLSLSTTIANAAATFESIWDVGDNSGFGITGLVSGFNHDPEESIDRLLMSPICGSLEHDASLLYINSDTTLPDPPATELFAFVFPLTPSKVQESVLEQVKTFMSTGSLHRDPGRKAAMNVNVATAVLLTLRVASKETQAAPGDVTNMAVERLLQDMLRDFVIDGDQLCNACGNAFTNQEIKYLVDVIVTNREPSARAGSAMALGAIQRQNVLGVLMSLCNDPHPTALALAADAAGLSFSAYVPSTLGMLVQLYTASAVTMNLEMESSTIAAIARCVDSLINDSIKSRELILTLLGQFQEEEENLLEHLSLYAPGYMEFENYVKLLQKFLNSEYTTLRDVARNPTEGFEEELWLVLDTDPTHDGIRNIIRNWLRQTALTETTAWLQRIQGGEDEPTQAKSGGMPDLQDEEVAGFAAAGGATKDDPDTKTASEVEPLRLDDLFILINKDVTTNGEVADVVRMAFSASTSGVIIGNAMLLEQYQAQISSALTPAFASDSSPELASEAVNVCAGFISTGIVTDTLVTGLENFSKETENAGIGDLKGLSSNAQVMVKMSVFSASEQKYLLESLREFARLRFEPDISMTLGPPSLSGSLDTIYAALNRETLLKFYQDSCLIEQDSEFESEGPSTNGHTKGSDINYRDEPVAFFFALATRPGQQNLAILQALKKILHPSAIFSETMDLLDRLVLTEGLDVQGVIVEIARALCESSDDGNLSDDIEQLFELTRIIVLSNQPTRHQMTEEAILLIKTALDALVDAAETDLHACIIHIFATILATPSCQQIIRFITSMSSRKASGPEGDSATEMQLLSCLRRFLSIYLNAQKREVATSLTCNQLGANEPLLIDCLSDRMTAKIAANCIRSLLSQSTASAADQSIARYLLPRLIAFVTNTDPEDPEKARGLVIHALAQYVGTVAAGPHKDRASSAMALVLPTLLARASAEGRETYIETGARLLELAAADQTAFRAVVGSMSESQRAFLEEVIRWGRQADGEAERAARAGSTAGGQPTIELKMNFGG
ncbi:HEAT repeat protein [Plectosphaerella plurivora]|uniref:HEAT repeat protein n=1 Tax=Plectosphaerella plurivora TaxID=936078 RepID=A0A9P8VJR7_9PEZI|nr:HEAT repeat protein [Plectosphaerella plurivora]